MIYIGQGLAGGHWGYLRVLAPIGDAPWQATKPSLSTSEVEPRSSAKPKEVRHDRD